jgi:hypothetical protein
VGDGEGGPDSDGNEPDEVADGPKLLRIVPAMNPATSSMATSTNAAQPKAVRPLGRLLGC